MNALGQLMLARLREFFREPSALFWTYGFPVLLALALGLAFQEEGEKRLHVGVVQGEETARWEQALRDDGITVVPVIASELQRAFVSGEMVFAISAQDGLTYHFDPSYPHSDALRRRVNDAIQGMAGRQDPMLAHHKTVRIPGARYIDFLIPGLIGLNIMSSSMWGIGYTIVEARKRKVLKRLAATPMSRGSFLLSFIFARLVFLATEVVLVLLFAHYMFGVQIQGSWILVALLCILGAMAFAGLAMMAASRTHNTETVSGLMNLIMLPMWVLSGVFFSATQFPEWMQVWIRYLPLTLLNDGLRAVINEGAGFIAVTTPFFLLTVIAGVFLSLSVRIFRWTV